MASKGFKLTGVDEFRDDGLEVNVKMSTSGKGHGEV